MPDKPGAVGPCARCGRQVTNAHMIGSLLVGKVCWKKMLAEGFNEVVHRCPLCHQNLPDDRKLSVRDDQVVLEPTVKSLDEFSEHRTNFVPPPTGATFKLLSVEVVHEDGSVTPLAKDEKGEGNDDGAANGGDGEGGRAHGEDDASGAGGSDAEAEAAEEVHHGDIHQPSRPPDKV